MSTIKVKLVAMIRSDPNDYELALLPTLDKIDLKTETLIKRVSAIKAEQDRQS